MQKSSYKNGFSFIEVLLVVGLIMILASLTIPVYGNLQVMKQSSEAVSEVVQVLRQARFNAIAGFNDASFGVYFDIDTGTKDKCVLYTGVSYATRDTEYDREIIFDNSISLSTTLSGDEINYSSGTGQPSNIGDVNLDISDYGIKTISINEIGIANED